AVLNAEDPLVAEMADDAPGTVIFFAQDGAHPTLLGQRQAGHRVVFPRAGRLILAHGQDEADLMALADIPATMGGRVAFQIANALAAAAACWGAGGEPAAIRRGLRAYDPDAETAP